MKNYLVRSDNGYYSVLPAQPGLKAGDKIPHSTYQSLSYTVVQDHLMIRSEFGFNYPVTADTRTLKKA